MTTLYRTDAMVSSSRGEEVDGLFNVATACLRERKQLVVVGLWQRFRRVSLLPFEGYFGRAPFHELLPVHPRFGIISFDPEDEDALYDPIYDTRSALLFRRQDRARRGPKSAEPLTLADWEAAVCKRADRFRGLILPAASFFQIVNPVTENRYKRPLFARIARAGPKPTCLFYARGSLSLGAISALSQVDFLLINIQSLRGKERVESLCKVLVARGMSQPTLMIAASPSDLLIWEDRLKGCEFVTIGSTPPKPAIEARIVGRERLQAEKEFEFAFGGLNPTHPEDARLLTLAKSSWWASHQQLGEKSSHLELQRFQAAYSELEANDATKANSLTFGKRLLEREASNMTALLERQKAVLDTSLSAKGGGGLLIITRNWSAADQLRLDFQKEGWSSEDLAALNVLIRPASPEFDCNVDTIVTAGFFGTHAFDKVLAARATNIYLILDPIELRALWFTLGRVSQIAQHIQSSPADSMICGIRSSIEDEVPAFVSELSMTLNVYDSEIKPGTYDASLDPVPLGHVGIILSDGTRLDVRNNARFEVVSISALKLETVKAQNLQPGDQIILLDSDARERFSERLLTVIDTGQLATPAEARRAWFEIVKAARSECRSSTEVLAKEMQRRGERASSFNTRSWLPTEETPQPCIPDTVSKFLAFAGALGIALPNRTLHELYNSIQRWRHGHRKCGRYLARAIRGAYSGRLDAGTLARIERDWGMTTRHLMQAAVLETVETIVKSQDVMNGINRQ